MGVMAKPNEESKSARFQRIARKRVPKAARAINLVGNLGNKSLYESTEDERRQIISHLDKALKQMKKDLAQKAPKERETFDFKKE